ncbi:MAG: 6-phospho-3-hexuloisomerase [Streptococcaceae bacterium]|jgi:6-phospho-3-hexuloisomerase|nr:6-phospho-3-hexuloisomerase [Streptococcaceae bacterium]
MELLSEVLAEIMTVMDKVDEKEIKSTIKLLNSGRRIFILGEGRSGLQGKAFAMRLMHIGFNVFVIGETITPSVQTGDVLVAISGSGTTSTTIELAEKAKKAGIKILGITSERKSPLAEMANEILIIPGATKTGSGIKSIQLLSSLFDQTLHITLDFICLLLSRERSISNEAAKKQHSNME